MRKRICLSLDEARVAMRILSDKRLEYALKCAPSYESMLLRMMWEHDSAERCFPSVERVCEKPSPDSGLCNLCQRLVGFLRESKEEE